MLQLSFTREHFALDVVGTYQLCKLDTEIFWSYNYEASPSHFFPHCLMHCWTRELLSWSSPLCSICTLPQQIRISSSLLSTQSWNMQYIPSKQHKISSSSPFFFLFLFWLLFFNTHHSSKPTPMPMLIHWTTATLQVGASDISSTGHLSLLQSAFFIFCKQSHWNSYRRRLKTIDFHFMARRNTISNMWKKNCLWKRPWALYTWHQKASMESFSLLVRNLSNSLEMHFWYTTSSYSNWQQESCYGLFIFNYFYAPSLWQLDSMQRLNVAMQ